MQGAARLDAAGALQEFDLSDLLDTFVDPSEPFVGRFVVFDITDGSTIVFVDADGAGTAATRSFSSPSSARC